VNDETIDPEFRPLLEQLADAFDDARLEPIPPRLSAAAHDAYAWRRADAELAELLFDSASETLVGVRGTATTDRRSFRYASGDFAIRVHLTDVSLIVMIEPPLSVACTVDSAQGSEQHRTDELGELVVDAPELPLRLEVELPSGNVVTPWITG
jgi:hypothetical protein